MNKFDEKTEKSFGEIFKNENCYFPEAGHTCEMRSRSESKWVKVSVGAVGNGKMTGTVDGKPFAIYTDYFQFRQIK